MEDRHIVEGDLRQDTAGHAAIPRPLLQALRKDLDIMRRELPAAKKTDPLYFVVGPGDRLSQRPKRHGLIRS